MKIKATVHGKGINDLLGKYPVHFDKCVLYKTWKKMLGRCYDPKYQQHRPTYIGCTVCDEWLTFSNFRQWMETQDWEGKVLDKDLLYQGNKVYSPDTCVFIPPEINTLIVAPIKKGKTSPTGISFQQSSQKYIVSCAIDGKNKNLGRFACPDKAFSVYKEFKENLVKQKAEQYKSQIDERAYQALMNFKVKEKVNEE